MPDFEDQAFGLTDDELDAECRLLGTLIAEPDKHFDVIEALGPDNFGVPYHRAMFAILVALREAKLGCSMSFAASLLENHPEFDHFGGDRCFDDLAKVASPETLPGDMALTVRRSVARVEAQAQQFLGVGEVRH